MQPAGERDITQATPDEPSARSERETDAAPSISLETLAWAGVVLAAVFLRLADLDGLPFAVDEAARSFDASRVAGGDVPETWRGDLAAAATSYLFRIFGETEFVARIIPAVSGLALVAAMWLTRSHIGRTGALIAAALVAFSPLLVLHSRTATAYGVGPLLSVIIAVSLLEYLRSPRTTAAFPLILSLALTPLTDAPAVLALLATIVFLALEALLFRNRDLSKAWKVFRSSPVQWISALLVVTAAIQLGITRFGTSLDAGLPGIQLLTDMFALPRDSRPPEFALALLLGYDWPLLAAGAAGFALTAVRIARRRPLEAFDRFVLVWTLVAAAAVGLATQREAGQLLILLPPLALLGGRLAQELATRFDWTLAHRWWPGVAALAGIVALAALLMTEWSSGNASRGERALLAGALPACVVLISAAHFKARAAVAVALPVAIVVAAAFLTHSSLAVALGGGTEFAVDARLTPRAEQLKITLDRLSAERDSEVVLDADLLDELGWTLRDSRVIFGGEPTAASILVTRPNAAPSFAELADIWRVSVGWYPDAVLAPRRMWRWLLYREPFGAVEAVELRIYVRTISR